MTPKHAVALDMRPAALADRPVIAAILEDARQWLAARDIAQWTRPFGDDWIDQKIDAGEFHVAYRAGAPIAVVRLLWEDAVFWGEPDRTQAAYVHTLVVHRDEAGHGFGAQILEWVASQARSRGRHALRLDCAQANHGLVEYYLDNGFVPAGQVEVVGEVMILLEKKLES